MSDSLIVLHKVSAARNDWIVRVHLPGQPAILLEMSDIESERVCGDIDNSPLPLAMAVEVVLRECDNGNTYGSDQIATIVQAVEMLNDKFKGGDDLNVGHYAYDHETRDMRAITGMR